MGKTISWWLGLSWRSEHPHACGENGIRADVEFARHGTSPRLWGKLIPNISPCSIARNIPTLVGKTGVGGQSQLDSPEHPHACGENCMSVKETAVRAGTSPRLWGKRVASRGRNTYRRNIPTLVGKTSRRARRLLAPSEHPHACGENDHMVMR